MILPDAVRVRVEEVLNRHMPSPTRVLSGRRVGGGCIHHALEVTTSRGPLFLKWNRGPAAAAFSAEARGLDALRAITSDESFIAVPHVIGFEDAEGADGLGWLALDYLPPSGQATDYEVRLGRGIAHLHTQPPPARATSDDPQPSATEPRSPATQPEPLPAPTWGWHEDNRIGPLVQRNPDSTNWGAFWRTARLEPRVLHAEQQDALRPGDRTLLHRVLDATESVLADIGADQVSLVHGDLWAGNMHPGPDGRPVLVDPAAYRGHREVDVAMAELFGGLSARAMAVYEETAPLSDAYRDVRRPLYQLYYLLAHLNLFGAEYLPSVRRCAKKVLRAVD
jgi:fructosamine-3-kinase